jgi:hypothetical protein
MGTFDAVILHLDLKGHVACMREMINAYKLLVGTSESTRLVRRSGRRCEDNIRMYLRGIGRKA